jgi:hypothetical protein
MPKHFENIDISRYYTVDEMKTYLMFTRGLITDLYLPTPYLFVLLQCQEILHYPTGYIPRLFLFVVHYYGRKDEIKECC